MGQAPVEIIAFDLSQPRRIFAYNIGGLWSSIDAGTTWSPVPLKTLNVHALAIDPTDDQNLYAGTDVNPTGWVGKLKADGTLSYATYLGGSYTDGIHSAATDAAGDTFVTGYTYSSDFPVSAGALKTTLSRGASQDDAFVTRLAPNGAMIYSTYLGGTGIDSGNAVVALSDGRAYVAGFSSSPDFPLVNPIQTIPGTPVVSPAPSSQTECDVAIPSLFLEPLASAALSLQTNAFISELAPDGSQLSFSTILTGTGNFGLSSAMNLALAKGGVVVAGSTSSANFPITLGAFSTQLNSNAGSSDVSSDIFIAKLGRATGPQLSFASVLNDASRLAQPLAQGELITIAVAGQSTALPEDTEVLLNGLSAEVRQVNSESVTAEVPFNLPLTELANLELKVRGNSSNTLLFPVRATSPGIYTADGSGKGQAVAFNQDGSVNSASNPASRGTTVTINVTGAGVPDSTPVILSIGGEAAKVTAIGPAPGQPNGVAQISATIAANASTGGALPVVLLMNSISAQTGVTIAVQ